MENSPRIVYVCSLCLRQYDLQEDLRGHMVYFHGCQVVSPPVGKKKTPKARQKKVGVGQDHAVPEEPIDDPKDSPKELKPMPFKDFRLVLRANMLEPSVFHKDSSQPLQNTFILGAPLARTVRSSFSMPTKWNCTLGATRTAVSLAVSADWNCLIGGDARPTCGKATK